MNVNIKAPPSLLEDCDITQEQLQSAIQNALGTLTNPDTGETIYLNSIVVTVEVESC